MAVVECSVPAGSALDPQWVRTAWFVDAYRAPVRRPEASVTDLFQAIFGHHPAWMKGVLIARNRLATVCGLDAPTTAEILHPAVRNHYAVGDTIGVWPIHALTPAELVAGRNNKHLDFRLSVLKTAVDDSPHVVVSTVCVVHNWFGKLYLFFIIPFHKWGLQRLLRNAVVAGRL